MAPTSPGGSRSNSRRWASAAGGWAAERLLVLALGMLAALPIVVAMCCAVAQHWAPLGDNAFIGIRAYDVFTSRTPLVGQRSSGASAVLPETAYSPGPLLFWLLAIPARLPDSIFLMLTACIVNIAAVMGTVALALRRGGRLLMFATAVAIPVMLASLPPAAYSDVWNPSAPLLPLMLLVFLAWSLACGEYRLLPIAVVVGSFVAQTHLTFLGPVVALTAVAGVCAVLLGKARRWPRRWVVGSLVLLIICWSAPLVDQAIHRPGNLVLLKRSALADEPSLGFRAGWRALVGMAGIPPWWLQDDPEFLERIDELESDPPAFAIATALLVLAGLAAAVASGWRRRRADTCAAGAIGLALCVAIALGASSTPTKSLFSVSYTLRWASPAGMCVWLLLAWSLPAIINTRGLVGRRWPAQATGGAVAAVAAVATVIAVAENPPQAEPYKPMRAIFGQLDAQLPARGGTLVETSSLPRQNFLEALRTDVLTAKLEDGIVYWLRRAGRPLVTKQYVAERLEDEYARGSYVRVVNLAVDTPPPKGGRTLLSLAIDDDRGFSHGVTVSLRPERGRATGSPAAELPAPSR